MCICCTLQLALYVYLGTKKWLKITWQEKKETTTKQLSMTQTTKRYQISELWLLNQGMVVIKPNDELKQLFVFSTFLILLLRKPCVLSYGCEITCWKYLIFMPIHLIFIYKHKLFNKCFKLHTSLNTHRSIWNLWQHFIVIIIQHTDHDEKEEKGIDHQVLASATFIVCFIFNLIYDFVKTKLQKPNTQICINIKKIERKRKRKKKSTQYTKLPLKTNSGFSWILEIHIYIIKH